MNHEETREKLINGAICVMARDGLDKTTTRQIATETSINEVYIYRCFTDKEDLFCKMFESLDNELVSCILRHLPIMYQEDMEYELRCRFLFSSVWSFMLGARDRCLAYVQYYYSPYFMKYSATTHEQRYAPVLEKFKDAFKSEAQVWLILGHILNVLLDFAVKVHNDQMPKADNYSEHVFRVVYASIRQYFRNAEEGDSE